jgi:hypothetical protein
MITGITQYQLQHGGEFMKIKKVFITAVMLVAVLLVLTFAIPELHLLLGLLYNLIFG